MTTVPHTPGPWVIGPSHDPLTYSLNQAGNPFLQIAWLTPMIHRAAFDCDLIREGENQLEDRANLRLIAAAPDLLEACRQALDAEDFMGPHSPRAILTAAIQKATE